MDGAFTVATGTRSELGGELVAIPDPLLYGGQHSSDDHKHQRRSPPDMHHGYLLGLIVDVIAKGDNTWSNRLCAELNHKKKPQTSQTECFG
jgi:hypothetical protein